MKRKRDEGVQMYYARWYLDKFDLHECCDCGMIHKTQWKVEKGKIFTQWNVDRRATTANRKKLGIKVTRGS